MLSSGERSWGPETFDRIYATAADPWDFTGSVYERDKYALTLAALGGRRFGDALEIGCSIGVFTRQLAARCDRLLAVDVADAALVAARRRCAGVDGVQFARKLVPADWPAGMFDLIVLSEVLYFLSAADIAATAGRAVAGLRPGGAVLLVNWTGATDTPSTGDGASAGFEQAAALALQPRLRMRGATFRIDLLHGAR